MGEIDYPKIFIDAAFVALYTFIGTFAATASAGQGWKSALIAAGLAALTSFAAELKMAREEAENPKKKPKKKPHDPWYKHLFYGHYFRKKRK